MKFRVFDDAAFGALAELAPGSNWEAHRTAIISSMIYLTKVDSLEVPAAAQMIFKLLSRKSEWAKGALTGVKAMLIVVPFRKLPYCAYELAIAMKMREGRLVYEIFSNTSPDDLLKHVPPYIGQTFSGEERVLERKRYLEDIAFYMIPMFTNHMLHKSLMNDAIRYLAKAGRTEPWMAEFNIEGPVNIESAKALSKDGAVKVIGGRRTINISYVSTRAITGTDAPKSTATSSRDDAAEAERTARIEKHLAQTNDIIRYISGKQLEDPKEMADNLLTGAALLKISVDELAGRFDLGSDKEAIMAIVKEHTGDPPQEFNMGDVEQWVQSNPIQ